MTALYERMIGHLGALIAFPSVSTRSNLDVINYIESVLAPLGARISRSSALDGKANILASLGPDRPGGVVLSGHTDVVPVTDQPWSSDPFGMVERDGRYYGRGTCDMKGFIACCLALAPDWAAADLPLPIHFAFTHDEESGCIGARALLRDIAESGIAPAAAIIGEPTSMRLVNGHKGCCEYTVRFRGLEGHGSQPERGANAVEAAARYVTRLIGLREDLIARAPADGRFDPPWSTINIGRLSGGVAHNVIAGAATLDWEMRPVAEADRDHVASAIADFVAGELLPDLRRAAPEAGVVTEVIGEVEGLSPIEDGPAIRLVRRMTGANALELVSYGTEAGMFQTAGIAAVICGPGDIAQAHKADEFVARAQLEQCLAMLGELTGALGEEEP